jgi:hypothetical protein
MSDFYDDKKKCRKNWRDTPEHLTLADWMFLECLRTAQNREEFEQIMQAAYEVSGRFVHVHPTVRKRLPFEPGDRGTTYDFIYWFFNRVIGWPEGRNYYFGGSSVAKEFYYPSLLKDIYLTD